MFGSLILWNYPVSAGCKAFPSKIILPKNFADRILEDRDFHLQAIECSRFGYRMIAFRSVTEIGRLTKMIARIIRTAVMTRCKSQIDLTFKQYVTSLVTFMAGNSRFATAIHVAGILSFADRMPMTSDAIAKSCATNPVVIRRILGLLAKHGLVAIRKGTGGGARLTRPPERITLVNIYDALEEGALFDVPQFGENHQCDIAKVVRPVVAEVLREAEDELRNNLRERTLSEVIELVRIRMPENRQIEIDRFDSAAGPVQIRHTKPQHQATDV